MNELRIFENPEFGEVRTVAIGGEYWFVGADVARALGYSKLNEAVRTNTREMDTTTAGVIDSIGRTQQMVVINESGLYDMIFESRLPKARDFRHWVTSDVLPELRRTGSYSIQSKPDSYTISDPVERAKRWIEEQEENRHEIQVRDDRITELEPKAMICDEMISSNMLTSFRDAAYILGISQSQFTGWLEENGYVYRNADNMLRPTEKYRNSGLFEVKPFKSRNSYYTGVQTHITAKGMAVFKVILNSTGHTSQARRAEWKKETSKIYIKFSPYGEQEGVHMCCEHCENDFNPEEDIIVNAGGAVRAVLMDVGDVLIDICKGLDIDEIKIKVSHNYDTEETVFKAKVDGEKVLEITANDFVPYITD